MGTIQTSSNKILHNELAFDIDGVIANTFQSYVDMARNKYGIQIEYEDITDYDFRKVIDIDEDTSDEIIEMILEDPLGMGIRAITGAKEVLTRLSYLGPVSLITARTNRDAIIRWVHKALGLDGGVIRLEATGDHEEKLPILQKHGIRYFVEDRLETCYLIHKRAITPIVFDQPWNRKPHPFQTVKGWDEIRDMIDWGMG